METNVTCFDFCPACSTPADDNLRAPAPPSLLSTPAVETSRMPRFVRALRTQRHGVWELQTRSRLEKQTLDTGLCPRLFRVIFHSSNSFHSFRPVCSGLPDSPQQPALQPVYGSHLLPHGISEVRGQTACARPAGTPLRTFFQLQRDTPPPRFSEQTLRFSRVSPSCGATWSCAVSVRRACTTWAERCTSWASHTWPFITTRRPFRCPHRNWRFVDVGYILAVL